VTRTSWRHPGRLGAVLYAVVAAILGGLTASISRLQVERQRGRNEVAQRLPRGPIIVISNHTSYADGVLLALACRRLGRSLRMLATAGVFKVPVVGWAMRRLGFIAVKRGAADASSALDQAAEALAAGEAVGLYPEGRVTRHPERWPERSKTGAVRLALRTGAPVVPLAMVGAHLVVGDRHRIRSLVKALILRPRVHTRIGDPIDVRALVGTDDPTPDRIRATADTVMGRLVALVEGLRGEPAPDPLGVQRSTV
jgi:1-acyl-sn-glycerol-3-phosphate acyltransferase